MRLILEREASPLICWPRTASRCSHCRLWWVDHRHICTVHQITRQLFPRKLSSQKYEVVIEGWGLGAGRARGKWPAEKFSHLLFPGFNWMMSGQTELFLIVDTSECTHTRLSTSVCVCSFVTGTLNGSLLGPPHPLTLFLLLFFLTSSSSLECCTPWRPGVNVRSPRERGCHGVPSPPVPGPGGWGCHQENAGPPTSPEWLP